MSSIRGLFISAVLACAGAGIAGCAIAPSGPPAPPPTVKATALQPVFNHLPETPAKQTKGGVTFTVVPAIYQVKDDRTVKTEEIDRSIVRTYQVGVGAFDQQVRRVRRTTTPTLKVTPEKLQFRVTVNNQLDRAFRGQGMIVQFNVGGRLIDLPAQSYASLINTIIPPRGQAEVEVYGPPISALPPNSTVGLFIYDVVTKVDAAGNAVEKQNFEWYISYNPQTVEREGIVKIETIDEAVGPAIPVVR